MSNLIWSKLDWNGGTATSDALAVSPSVLEVDSSGAVSGVFSVSISGDSFTGENGAALSGVTFSGLPSGLTGVATRTGDSTASISFTGTATGLTPGQSVSVTVAFGDASFSGGSAAAVTGSTRALTLTMSDAPAKAKTLLFYGDSITTMGLYKQTLIDLDNTSADGEYLTVAAQSDHGFVPGDAVRVCGLNTELNKTYIVQEVPSTTTFKVLADFAGTIEKTSVGSPGSMRIEAHTTGFGNFGNWSTGNKADIIGSVAVWGARTPDFVSRFTDDVVNFSPKPDYVHVLGGTNDMTALTPVANVIANYEAMYQMATAAGIKCVWGCIPARKVFETNDPQSMALSLELVDATKTWCATHGIPYVDYMEATRDPETGYTYDAMAANGYLGKVHFSPYGNFVMGQYFGAVMEQLFEGGSKLPETAAECGYALNPLFSATESVSTAQLSGTVPTQNTAYVSIYGSSIVTSDVVPGQYGNIWKLSSDQLSPYSYGLSMRLAASIPAEPLAHDGYFVATAKIKYTRRAGILDCTLKVGLLRNGVANSYYYDNLNLNMADSWEFDYQSQPIYCKAGDVITLADPGRAIEILILNRDATDATVGAMDLELSQVSFQFIQTDYFPTR